MFVTPSEMDYKTTSPWLHNHLFILCKDLEINFKGKVKGVIQSWPWISNFFWLESVCFLYLSSAGGRTHFKSKHVEK